MTVRVWDKASGKAIEVTEAEAQIGITSGAYLAPKRALVTNPETGFTGYVDARDLQKRFEQGWTLGGEQDAKLHQAKDSPASAALLGAAEMATAGGLPQVARLTDELALTEGLGDEIQAIKEGNPGMHMSGQLALAAATLPISAIKGASAGAQAARAATAFPRAAQQAGLAAERATARLLGSEGIAAKVISKGAGGAVEGAFYGGAQGLSEADLGDTEAAAEHIAANMGMGALFGGGLTAALPVAGRVLQKGFAGTGKGIRNLYEAATGTVAGKGFGKKAGGILSSLQKKAKPEQAHIIDELGDATRRQELLGPNLLDDHARTVSAAQNATEEALDEARVVMSAGKMKRAEGLVKPPNDAVALNSVLAKLDDIDAQSAAMQVEHGAHAMLKNLRKITTEAKMALQKDASAGNAFRVMDKTKRLLDDNIQWKRMPGIDSVGDDIQKSIKSLRFAVKENLEQPQIWGPEAASMQKEVNALIGDLFDTESVYRGKFLARVSKGRGVEAFQSDPAKLRGILRDTTGAKNDLRMQAFRGRIDNQKETARLLRKHYELDAGTSKVLAKLEGATDDLERAFSKADADMGLRNQVNDMAGAAQQGALARAVQDRFTRSVAGGIAGGLPGIVLAHGVGEAIEAVSNPALHFLRLAKMEQFKANVQGHIKARVGGFFTKKLGEIPKRLGVGMRRMVSPTAVKLFDTKGPERQEAMQAKLTEVRETVNNPVAVQERVRLGFGPVAETAPNLVNSIANQILRNAGFLDSVAPKVSEWPTLFGPPPTLSDTEISKFARQVLIAEDPLAALDLLQKGELTLDETEALEAMYPALYVQMQEGIISYIAETGITDVPYAKRLQLGILFNMPTDPSLMPEQMVAYYEASQVLQQMEQEQAQQQQQPARAAKPMSAGARKTIKQGMSGMDQVAANRS